VPATGGDPVSAPLAGTVVKILVTPGQVVKEGESIIILEAMKMETSVSAPRDGTIVEVKVQSGDNCAVGDTLLTIA
jgi:oxaloacetate decarboxylase alpha subunit